MLDVRIDRIGDGGDGIGRPCDDGAAPTVYVAGALPGDRLRVRPVGRRAGGLVAETAEVLVRTAAAQQPPCPHFGACGGCALQHLDDPDYAAWKRDLAVSALGRAGLDPSAAGRADLVAPLMRSPAGSRRRVRWQASIDGPAVRKRPGSATPGPMSCRIGYARRYSHSLIDLEQCPILAKPLESLATPLRDLLPTLAAAGSGPSVTATLTEAGIDLLIGGSDLPGRADLETLAAFADRQDLARLAWTVDSSDRANSAGKNRPTGRNRRPPQPAASDPDGDWATSSAEIIVRRRPAILTFGDVQVEPPPGGFLQATAEGEAALAGFAVETLSEGTVPDGASIADLYCGCGSLTLPLARRWRVHAVDGAADALAALDAAVRAVPGLPVTSERRDLAARPLNPDELARYDAVLFDPPRTGAAAQASAIAASSVPLVIAVSCNPATFARDARLLLEGGYRLTRLQPVDQFLWSPHLEIAAAFVRP